MAIKDGEFCHWLLQKPRSTFPQGSGVLITTGCISAVNLETRLTMLAVTVPQRIQLPSVCVGEAIDAAMGRVSAEDVS